MIRLLGVLFILAGSTGYGVNLYIELKEGLTNVRYVIHMMDAFLSEVGFRRLSLPECCRVIAQESKEPYKTILERVYSAYELEGQGEFTTCWRIEMEKGLNQIPLSAEEKKVVTNLFEGAAIYDLERQKSILESRKLLMENYLKKREQEIAEKKRIYTSLGFMAGLLLVLILI